VGKLKQIKVLETRINFLLKHGGKDEARKLHGELLVLDPSNTRFKNDFEQVIEDEDARSDEQLQDYWTEAWSTLSEIEALAGQVERNDDEQMHFSWKQIEQKELLDNYREYAYALILSEEENSCL